MTHVNPPAPHQPKSTEGSHSADAHKRPDDNPRHMNGIIHLSVKHWLREMLPLVFVNGRKLVNQRSNKWQRGTLASSPCTQCCWTRLSKAWWPMWGAMKCNTLGAHREKRQDWHLDLYGGYEVTRQIHASTQWRLVDSIRRLLAAIASGNKLW